MRTTDEADAQKHARRNREKTKGLDPVGYLRVQSRAGADAMDRGDRMRGQKSRETSFAACDSPVQASGRLGVRNDCRGGGKGRAMGIKDEKSVSPENVTPAR